LPYGRNEDLPPAVQGVLPPHAQDIYRAAFNSAWNQRALSGALDEAAVHRIAWGAVKRQYRKLGGVWGRRTTSLGAQSGRR
jgi:cation transport regulator